MKGPILTGTNWFEHMSNPDNEGFMHLTGDNQGGHEWRIVGADRDKRCPNGSKGAIRMINSWGPNWNDHGRAWLSIPDLDRLIKEQGEAVTVDEIKIAGVITGWGDTELFHAIA